MDCRLQQLVEALSVHGLILRGGFHPEPGEPGLEGVGTVHLVGNAGPAMWRAFEPYIDGAPDPLNRWTMRVMEPIAAGIGTRAVYPFGETLWPFQRWARRAEALHASPIGLLIHPLFGLWHAYRAALFFAEKRPLPESAAGPSPCDMCVEKPCLSACPAGAFRASGYEVPACASYLVSGNATCGNSGCHARNICPVGQEWRYEPAQLRFHMEAFTRSVSRLAQPAPAAA